MKNTNPKPKGKSPAFQFYAADFYMDTLAWSDDMVGLHIRLLCQQWINDKIEADEQGYPVTLSEKQKHIFDKIKHKYFQEKNGKIINKKLDKIKQDKKEFVKNAVKAGRVGALRRWHKDSEPYGVPHQNPNGVDMALQPSSSSSVVNNSLLLENIKLMQLMRENALHQYTSMYLSQQAAEFKEKYMNVKIDNLPALIKSWMRNLPKEAAHL